MIIQENKIIDQFPTPKHQQIWLPLWKLLAFNVMTTVRWSQRDDRSEDPSQSQRSIFDNHQCIYTKRQIVVPES